MAFSSIVRPQTLDRPMSSSPERPSKRTKRSHARPPPNDASDDTVFFMRASAGFAEPWSSFDNAQVDHVDEVFPSASHSVDQRAFIATHKVPITFFASGEEKNGDAAFREAADDIITSPKSPHLSQLDQLINLFNFHDRRFGKLRRQALSMPLSGTVNHYIKVRNGVGEVKLPQLSEQEYTKIPEAVGQKLALQGIDVRTYRPPDVSMDCSSPKSAAINDALTLVRADDEFDIDEFDLDAKEVLVFGRESDSPPGRPLFSALRRPNDPLTTGHIDMAYSVTTLELPSDYAQYSAAASRQPAKPRNPVPRHLPPHFGYENRLDERGRKLWGFYVYNWCPGRTILSKSNPWMILASMNSRKSVLAACQALSAVYIHDYTGNSQLATFVDMATQCSERHLKDLVQDPAKWEANADEIISLCITLAMQDVILYEGQRQLPEKPRWLLGCQAAERILDMTDSGSRFWRPEDPQSLRVVQMGSQRVAHTVIVGRALILAQPMDAIPVFASTEEKQYQSRRFGWLLYGSQADVHEIQGGCGFSKKLLHMFSQITWMAAALQSPSTLWTQAYVARAKHMMQELLALQQWSSETPDWELNGVDQVLESIRNKPPGYVINTNDEMTHVTAEAWRLAAILYLQCRVFRLPRNHNQVIAHLSDLADCLRIMPTSGGNFSAQAPLLPVFLLGTLGTLPHHRATCRAWFDGVLSVPVRSSVPPLYEALSRLWKWVDEDSAITPVTPEAIHNKVQDRAPWWEKLVERVQRDERKVLCLT